MKPKLMFKTDLSSASQGLLLLVLYQHMTRGYADGMDWMQNLSFHGAALLNSDEVDDESMLTLQDLLAELHERKNR